MKNNHSVCASCQVLPWAPTAPRRCICHGVNLDLGASDHKQAGFLGVDRRAVKNVDFVWDLEQLPWPFPDNCVDQLLASHLLEHIAPKVTVDFWDEMWRILKPQGQLLVVVPHGHSYGMLQDPTHCSFYVEATFAYFCPAHISRLYEVYQPHPWTLQRINSYPLGNIECNLMPIKEEPHARQRTRARANGHSARHARG